jgi:hypothetical protein
MVLARVPCSLMAMPWSNLFDARRHSDREAVESWPLPEGFGIRRGSSQNDIRVLCLILE